MKFNIVRGVDEIKAFLNKAVNAVNGRESLLANRRSSCRGLFDMRWIGKGKGKLSSFMILFFQVQKRWCHSYSTVSLPQSHTVTLPREMRCGTPEGTVV